MWRAENRQRYNRDKIRYPINLTDQQWSWVERLIPPANRGGRRREVEAGGVLSGIMYGSRTGYAKIPRFSVAMGSGVDFPQCATAAAVGPWISRT